MRGLITRELAQRAVDSVIQQFHNLAGDGTLNRKAICIVVLKPLPELPDPRRGMLSRDSHILYEERFNEAQWEKPYDEIAFKKAALCWRLGMNSDDAQDHVALLLEGDCVHPGGVITDGMITGASGVQGWGDKLLATNTNHTTLALAWARRIELVGDLGVAKGPYLELPA